MRLARGRIALLAAALAATGCETDPGASADGSVDAAPPDGGPGKSTTVVLFDKQWFYYTQADDKRTIDRGVTFPTTGTYQKITLHLRLACPTGGCDPWDRDAYLARVYKGAGPKGTDLVVEVARFITPFGVGAAWDLDVTDLRPLLSGQVTLRGHIGTGVGPGSPYGGTGWLLSASFEMKGGVPSPAPIAVLPVWSLRNVPYGDPADPPATHAPATSLKLPSAASSAKVRLLVTGHGQGNLTNCAEFCKSTHTLTVAKGKHQQLVWRDDCQTTAAPNQKGTWQYPRTNWCPGADVRPWVTSVTADLSASHLAGKEAFSVGWEPEAYVNTCRPDASPCEGCALGTGCAYDGGMHTAPYWMLSAVLVAFR